MIDQHIAYRDETLDIMRQSIAMHLSEHDVQQKPELMLDRLPHEMAYRLIASMRIAGDVLQDDRIVAEYPATFWDHVRKVFGFSYRKDVVRVKETVLFPEMQLPMHGDKVRIMFSDRIERSAPCCSRHT